MPNPIEVPDANVTGETRASDDGGVSKAWGLSEEDRKTIDSLTSPMTGDSMGLGAGNTAGIFVGSASTDSLESGNEPVRDLTTQPSQLTHVKSSGEAHMVDVGGKDSTKRIAIALGQVRFSKADVLKLIRDNTNKKGDVLGVARIAGIMASKRTADIIPLCHPIAISKVEVDLSVVDGATYWSASHGAVLLQARVECVGPTGVEMEAMTAVHAAMLTVYDMCKAVDKSMVTSSRVVYKTGGRSGTWYDVTWLGKVYGKYFESQTEDLGPLMKGKLQDANRM